MSERNTFGYLYMGGVTGVISATLLHGLQGAGIAIGVISFVCCLAALISFCVED